MSQDVVVIDISPGECRP